MVSRSEGGPNNFQCINLLSMRSELGHSQLTSILLAVLQCIPCPVDIGLAFNQRLASFVTRDMGVGECKEEVKNKVLRAEASKQEAKRREPCIDFVQFRPMAVCWYRLPNSSDSVYLIDDSNGLVVLVAGNAAVWP